MDQSPTEYRLALRARRGDRDALTELVARTRARLFAQAYADLGHYEDAQDAVAAALVSICTSIQHLREPQRITSWMQAIVRNEAHALRRKRPPTDALGETDATVDDADHLLMRLDVERALHSLPRLQADALRLYYLDGSSVRDVAERTGGSEGAVKMWLHRGRRHLAAQMKGYDPMLETTMPEPTVTGVPPEPRLRPAAVLHTDLTPAQLQAIIQALRGGGFAAQALSPQDLPDFRADGLPLRDTLRGYEALVVDETVGGRSGLEYVLFCRAHPETANIPITLQHSQEENALLVTACYAAGVTHLARRDDPDALAAALRIPEEPRKGSWESFTERAREIVCQAQREAIRLGENGVATEHLLLGLVREADCAGARILAEKLRVPLEGVVEEVERRASPVSGRDEALDLVLTPRSRNVLDLAQEEAALLGHRYIGSEHLLLGLIREENGLAGQVLAALGVTMESTREVVRNWQAT